MTSKRDLWYTGLVLVTLERCRNLIIGFLVVNYPYRQNFRSLGPPHGLEEAPVVHQPVPDHLGDFFLAEDPCVTFALIHRVRVLFLTGGGGGRGRRLSNMQVSDESSTLTKNFFFLPKTFSLLSPTIPQSFTQIGSAIRESIAVQPQDFSVTAPLLTYACFAGLIKIFLLIS